MCEATLRNFYKCTRTRSHRWLHYNPRVEGGWWWGPRK